MQPPGAENLGMARARPHPKFKRRPTFIKAWRKHRNEMTLAQLSERLEEQTGVQLSEGQLSRIERGEAQYMQDHLEAIAIVLRTEPANLLNVDPTAAEPVYSIWETLTPVQRRRAERVIQAMVEDEKTGTDD